MRILHDSFIARVMAALAGFALAVAVSAEDQIVTQAKTHRGRVISADTNSVMIETTEQGQQRSFAVPRALIQHLTVEAPPSAVRGLEAFEKGNLKEALPNLAKVVAQYQGLDVDWAAKAMLYYARVNLLTGDYDKAEKAFRLFLNCYPDDTLAADAQVGMLEIGIARGKYEEVVPKLQELADNYDKQLKPSASQMHAAAEVYLGLGKSYEAQGNLPDALDAYLHVTALYPADRYCPEALYRAAQLYRKMEKPQQAQALLADLTQDYPSSEFAAKAGISKGAASEAASPAAAKSEGQ